jgi:hypothetical protein
MNGILLSHEVIIYLLSETLLYGLLFVAMIVTVYLLKRWNFQSFTVEQFNLENRSYLVMSIIFFALLLKLILLPYFVYMIDRLSDLVPGAMCGAGVIKANEYGNPLLLLKIMILFLSGLWLSINQIDLAAKNYPYLKLKSWFFIIIFILLTGEFILDILYLTHIDTTNPVRCCSVIFGQTGGSNGLPFGLDMFKLIVLFYLLYLWLVLSLLSKNNLVSIGVSILFVVVSYYAVVYWFGTYIYELPTHQCPFCMLQDHYYYVGYLLWGLLFLGAFFAIDGAVMHYFFKTDSKTLKKKALLYLTMFVILCSTYVVLYYFKNGVFL